MVPPFIYILKMTKINLTCLIDDDEIHIFTTKRIINKMEFSKNIIEFNNGKEALDGLTEIINSNQTLPELILLDLNMPIMDGWQFLDQFTNFKIEKSIKIYIVSSSIDEEDIERAKKYQSISNYIVKPISRQKLVKIHEEIFS